MNEERRENQPREERMMKTKHDHQFQHGDGGTWLRGPMIGKGSFGSVYLATLKKSKCRYSYFPSVMAVKSAEVSVSGSLQKEKEVLNNLQGCPYILRCFGEEITTGENGEMIFNLLLEYASGGTLADLIKKSSGCGLPVSDVRHYTRSILRGLKHIHECPYVHCDLKPENILLLPTTNKFIAKIGDFGLAKRASQSKRRRFDPYLRGTPLYLSPEAVVDNVQEPPSDIWALGCVVLEMLTGKPPWDRKTDLVSDDILSRIRNENELPKIPSEISKEGKDFLKGCFVRKAMYRLTAEMLLNHPFVAGLDEEDGGVEELEEVSDAEVACSSFLLSEDDDNLSSSYFSDDRSFVSEEDSPSSSWSEEAGELSIQVFPKSNEEATMGVQTRRGITCSSFTPKDDDRIVETLTRASSKPMQQYQSPFTLPAGA